jgi:hypothetical protein
MVSAVLPIGSGPDTAPIPRVRLKFFTPPVPGAHIVQPPNTPLSTAQVVELQNRVAHLEQVNTKQLSDLKVARSSLDATHKAHSQYKKDVAAAAATTAAKSRDRTGTRSSPEAEVIQRCGELEVKVQRLEADNDWYMKAHHEFMKKWFKKITKLREVKAVSDMAHFKLKVASVELVALGKLHAQLQERYNQNQQEGRKSAQGEAAADKVNQVLGRSMRTISEQYAAATGALASASEKVESLQGELENVSAERDELAEEVARGREGKMGRPSGFAGRAAIEAKWESYASNAARNKAILRHQSEIRQVLQDANCSDWLPAALAGALKLEGLLEDLWATRLIAKLRWEFAKELSEVLHAEWNVQLALYCKLDVELSNSQYLKLRLAFCKQYDGKAWRKRIWYRCPVLGQELPMPQPLVSEYHWFPIWRSYAKKYGIELDKNGKVARRDFLDTLRKVVARDREHMFDPTPERPWTPVFGIDGTSISIKRSFSHDGISLGPCYDTTKAVQSELKFTTCGIGQYHDDLAGQDAIMGTVTAAQITKIYCEGSVEDLDPKAPGSKTPVRMRGCFDLAAARGMRACFGKAACLCACRGAAMLQAYPGDAETTVTQHQRLEHLPSIPAGDSEEVWEEARTILRSFCSYGSEKMSAASLLMASHTPPADWDGSPWSCSHCNRVVYQDPDHYLEVVMEHRALQQKASSGNKRMQALLRTRMSDHAAIHVDALLLAPMTVRVGTDFFIVDPMHAFELNLIKTAWKYSFGDRMEEEQRDSVAEYLDEIDLPLDIRTKGKRNPEQKWFTASAVDDFFLGVDEGSRKVPALADNIWAILQRVIPEPTVATPDAPTPPLGPSLVPPLAPPVTAPQPAPVPRGGRKRLAPLGGFSDGSAQPPAAKRADENSSTRTAAPLAPQDAAMRRLIGFSDADQPAVKRFLEKRFGSRVTEAVNILRLWEAADGLFHAWRDEWTSDDSTYRASRALRFLRAAIQFSEALNLVSNYKHKSWYVHLCVFVVPQQLADEGNSQRFSTAPIESRGARLKRTGRRVVSWRKYLAPSAIPGRLYISRKTGAPTRIKKQGYASSPMHQMLMRMCASEDMWHSLSTFARPDKLRLQHQLRTRHLKCEMVEEGVEGRGGRGSGSGTMLSTVTQFV